MLPMSLTATWGVDGARVLVKESAPAAVGS